MRRCKHFTVVVAGILFSVLVGFFLVATLAPASAQPPGPRPLDADTVDGLHASDVPQADTPPVGPPVTTAATESVSISTSTIYLPTIFKDDDSFLIFFDDFSDPGSGWSIGDDGNISRSYQNGEYEILLHNEGWWAGNSAPISNDISSYSVEADIRLHTGSTSTYGLIFDRVDWDHFYLFEVHPSSQSYSLWSIDSGWFQLVPSTSSSFINSGIAINHLKVQRDGSQVTMYVNGRLMTTANNNTHVGNFREVGIFAESVGEAPVAVRFDNFRVRRLANLMAESETDAAEISEATTGQGHAFAVEP